MNMIWAEKYRPKTIKDCVLPKNLMNSFLAFLKKREFPNMLFYGKPGVGKTTVAKALCEDLKLDYMVINGSDESGIDTFRGKVKSFSTTVSFYDTQKCLIIDEADYLNPQSFQPAMRNFLEEYSKNCRFIFTVNYKQKIIDPLQSRLTCFDFSFPQDEKLIIISNFYNRIKDILNEENITFDEKVVGKIVVKYYPDFRKTISELEKYAKTFGTIDIGILTNTETKSLKNLISFLKDKKYAEIRKWVTENLDSDPNILIRQIYDAFENHLQPASRPSLVLILAQYQYQLPFVADPEIHMTAMLTEIMINCAFQDK